MTLFMQKALQIPPLQAGLVFVPLALTFIIASRVQRRAGQAIVVTLVLIEGCAIQNRRPRHAGVSDCEPRIAGCCFYLRWY